jgi:hypothetical protein
MKLINRQTNQNKANQKTNSPENEAILHIIKNKYL